MQSFLITLFQCTFFMSLVTLLYAAILPLLSRRYEAKWRYLICLVIAIGWVFPFRPRIDLSFPLMKISDIPIMPIPAIINNIQLQVSKGNIVNSTSIISFWQVLAVIWILGIVSVVVYQALKHRRFLKILHRWSEPVTDLELLGILDSLKLELGIKAQIRLSVCYSITSPMLIGFFHPTILLPDTKFAVDEVSLILKHELIHFKRYDLWWKALIIIATALHWFNPIVYFMAKVTAVQCEISCDALVLQDADLQKRKQYGKTIIEIVRNGTKIRTALSTNFYGGKKDMKNRISSIMDIKRKKTGVIILCIVLVCIMITGVAFATSEILDRGKSENRQIPVEDGKAFANLTQDGELEVKGKELHNYQLFTNTERITVSIPNGEYTGEFVLYNTENNTDIQQFVLNGTNRTKTFKNLTSATNYYILASGIDNVKVTISD